MVWQLEIFLVTFVLIANYSSMAVSVPNSWHKSVK